MQNGDDFQQGRPAANEKLLCRKLPQWRHDASELKKKTQIGVEVVAGKGREEGNVGHGASVLCSPLLRARLGRHLVVTFSGAAPAGEVVTRRSCCCASKLEVEVQLPYFSALSLLAIRLNQLARKANGL